MNGAGKRFVCEGCKKESGNEWEGGNDREGEKKGAKEKKQKVRRLRLHGL